MTELLQNKLKFLRKFQQHYPNSHIGGSVGLMLHGIDLQRDLDNSDLDVTMPEFDVNLMDNFDTNVCYTNVTNEYEIGFKIDDIKVEIRVNPEPTFNIIQYGQNFYNVSILSNIIYWKTKYAKFGEIKHIRDLFVIKFEKIPTNIEFTNFCKLNKFNYIPKTFETNFYTNSDAKIE